MHISELKNDIINHFIFDSHDIINKRFFVVRRNISGIPFKYKMEKEDFDKIDIVFSNFIEKLPV